MHLEKRNRCFTHFVKTLSGTLLVPAFNGVAGLSADGGQEGPRTWQEKGARGARRLLEQRAADEREQKDCERHVLSAESARACSYY